MMFLYQVSRNFVFASRSTMITKSLHFISQIDCSNLSEATRNIFYHKIKRIHRHSLRITGLKKS